jgi:uncharacterized protein YndB with AHSA1/START domain
MTEAKMAEETTNVYEIEIRSTPERIWQGLTDGDTMEKFFMGLRIESEWTPGSDYGFRLPDGSVMVQGQVVECDPPRKLVTTFQPHSPTGELIDIAESRLTWEITELGETCKLVLVHDRLDATNPHSKSFGDGWNMFLTGLKTYLEE